MSKINIVLTTYNGEKYIKEQLESIKRQTFSDFVVDIYDDGSSDLTEEIVKDFCKLDLRFVFHKNENNLGYTKNFIQGILSSKEDYVMLSDQDDIWNEDKVEKTFETMKSVEQKNGGKMPILVFSDAMNFDSDSGEKLGLFHSQSHLNTELTDTAHILMENKIIGCTAMINRAAVSKLENDKLSMNIDKVRVHDWWLALICAFFGRIAYYPKPTLQYRQHSGNMIGTKSFSEYIKNRISGLKEQKSSLIKTYEQADAFLKCYSDELNSDEKKMLEAFVSLKDENFFRKLRIVFKYHFFKSGLVRNIGLIVIL